MPLVDSIAGNIADSARTVGNALINLTQSFGAIYNLLSFFCYLSAFILLMVGIHRLSLIAEHKDRSGATIGGVVIAMVIASTLAYVPNFMNTLSCTAALGETPNIWDYASNKVIAANEHIAAVFDLVRLIGVITFIKSIFMLRSLAQGTNSQNVTWGSAKWTMIGGVICYNIVPTITILANTFGIPGVITKLGIDGNQIINLCG